MLGGDPSQILGQLNANGQVWILNPNGLLFGASAQVNVGGLVASTLNISDADFLAGERTFSGSGGTVVNRGAINAADGGYVALLGGQVSNEGVIAARLGTVALAAGNRVTLDFSGDKLLNVQVDEGALDALAQNKQLIRADGGTVLMTAQAANALTAAVVNNTGIIEARSIENHNGVIKLLGDMQSGTVNVGGTLDASAIHPPLQDASAPQLPPLQGEGGGGDGSDGGFIETSAAHVKIAADAHITTEGAHGGQNGQWLIDPYDFTIASSGGDITGAALSAALGVNNVIIQTLDGAVSCAGAICGTGNAGDGDIFVNDTVSWSANTLTLNAWHNIEINAQMNASGSAGLALYYGQGAVAAGNTANYRVNAPVNLASTGSFSTKLGSNGALITYTIITSLGAEGSITSADLQGINGNRAGNYVLGSNIDASATSGWNAGAGFVPIGTNATQFTGRFDGLGHSIENLTINRPGTDKVGLFGYAHSSQIRNVGLLGGSVTGQHYVGGLVGFNWGGSIENAYATGAVSGNQRVGGLVGYNSGGSIGNAYATGAVSGNGDVGGLVGQNWGSIENAYATGSVTASDNYAGGLVGRNAGNISHTYATGAVTGTVGMVGGLVGRHDVGGIASSYWDKDTTGQINGCSNSAACGGSATGLTTAQAFDPASYGNLDLVNTWFMADMAVDGGYLYTRPFLRSEWSASIHNAHQLQLMAMNLSASYTLARDIDLAETGAFGANPSGMWNGRGFLPVGYRHILSDISNPFTGNFDGQGHTLTGLTHNTNGISDAAGLFGMANGGTLKNVGLLNVNIQGRDAVGALLGLGSSHISNSYVDGGSVSGSNNAVGGLVGSGSVNGSISNSYTNVSVTAGNTGAGGLAGISSGIISNSYATGSVTGNVSVGGLAGQLGGSGRINNSYATGLVSDIAPGGPTSFGGLVGSDTIGALVSNSYWDKETTGQNGSAGSAAAFGLTTAQMQDMASFSGWDIDDAGGTGKVWRIYEGHTAPLLRSFLTPLNLLPVYRGDGTDGALANIGALGASPADPLILGAHTGNTLTLKKSGASASYQASADLAGLYSSQQGYDLSAVRDVDMGVGATADLVLDNPIAWTNGTLAIDAAGAISANAAISGGAGSAFILRNGNWNQVAASLPDFAVNDFRLSGGSFVRALDGDGSALAPYQLADIYGVQGMATLLNQHFTLANDIDAAGTANWNAGAGFVPVGNNSTGTDASRFSGIFDGLGHTIENLTINRPTWNYVGLFGYTITGSQIRNVGLVGGSVTGYQAVGGLVGRSNSTIIKNVYATGAVTGNSFVGGLLGDTGDIGNSSIENAYATGAVTGNDFVGGLVGDNWTGSSIKNAYATGAVTGNDYVGGLAGDNWDSSIENVYATGAVTGNDFVGGLVGDNWTGSIENAYATGAVTGNDYVGGLVGDNWKSSIANAYATGAVTGNDYVGGLVGENGGTGGTIENAYATGTVTGNNSVGGLAGVNFGSSTINNSFYASTDGDGTAINNGGENDGVWSGNVNGTAKTLTDLQTLATFAAWGAGANGISATGGENTVWRIYEGHTAPLLRSFLAPLTVTANADAKTYDGNAYSGGNGVIYSTPPNANLLGVLSYGGTSQGAVNANSYVIAPTGLYSHQQGYDVSYVNGALTVNKVDLTLSGSRVYDGSTVVAGSILTATGVNGETFAVGGAGDASNLASKNVQAGSTLASVTGLTLGASGNGGLSDNYNALSATGSVVSVTPAELTLSGSRAYDGSTVVAGSVLTATGVNGETFAVGGAGDASNLASKNVQAGSALASVTGLTLGGSGNGGLSSNYNALGATGSAVSVTAKTVTLTAPTLSKTYDGGTAYTTTADDLSALAGALVGGDSVTSATLAYTDKNAGAGNKSVTLDAATISDGNGGNNYNVTLAGNAASTITPKAVTLTAPTLSKTYGGGTLYTTTGDDLSALAGALVGGDTVMAATLAYTDKNAGAGNKSVTLDAATISDGNGGNNYDVTLAGNAASTITPADLTLSGSRAYDGSTVVAGSVLTATGVNGESFAVNGAGDASNLASKHVQAGSALASVTGLTLGASGNGGLSGNYNALSTADSTVTITAKTVTLTAPTLSKTYDGNTLYTTTAGDLTMLAGALVGGDSVTSANLAYTDKNAGAGNKGVTLDAATISDGNGGNNYNVMLGEGTVALFISGIHAQVVTESGLLRSF